jgi:hypothetical protein
MDSTLVQLSDASHQGLIGIAGLIVGILGLVAAYAFFRKSRRVKEPSYSIRNTELIRNLSTKLEKLKITYNGEPILNLGITKLAFWNTGRETITTEDIPEGDRLRISIEGNGKILDAKIIEHSNPANKFSISLAEDRKAAILTFDYIDEYEGAIVELLYTTQSSDVPSFEGSVKGAGRPRQKRVVSTSELWLLFLFGLLLTISSAVAVFWGLEDIIGTRLAESLQKLEVPLRLAFAFCTLIYWFFFARFTRKRPKGFGKFEADF